MSASRRSLAPRTNWRLVLGVLLIVSSVVGTTWLVYSARTGHTYLAAVRDIAQDQVVTSADFIPVEGRVPSGDYLQAGQLEPNQQARRSLRAGELVRKDDFIGHDQAQRRSLVVTVAGLLPTDLRVGDRAELWFVAPKQEKSDEKPSVVATDVVFTKQREASSGLRATQGTQIEITVPVDQVSAVLATQESAGRLVLLPTGGR